MSWEKVRSNGGAAGVDRQGVEAYEKEAEKNLVELEKRLREGNYRAKPVKRVWIRKIGSKEKRPSGIPVVTDRIM
ncbi:MAG: group II intron reverse transcriptase/maturase, partial [Candidatus Brocadia sp.]